jgi:hypothetical protein
MDPLTIRIILLILSLVLLVFTLSKGRRKNIQWNHEIDCSEHRELRHARQYCKEEIARSDKHLSRK